ncbi:hypothetical protein [Natronococcus wangiae]|uniref:hypothetical protein n=1 Tax=Natronococcus wangiae TaxID=3068275 RepID=UPI0027400AFD|nr:hypothetical protein [Natronococcus sp. AD5]
MTRIRQIDDLVVLGRAAPEPISDGRHTVCLGGYSDTLGYVRLYPTQKRMKELQRWNVVSVPVESAAPNDTRDESYKIAGSKDEWDILHRKIEKIGSLTKSEQIQLCEKLGVDCRHRLNENHISLGMVKPAAIHGCQLKPQDDPTYQVTLTGERQEGKSEYPYKLYIEYECENCLAKNPHNQSCIEWGVYQYWNKNDDPEGVIDALWLNDDDAHHYFFIGNLNHHRTTYIIISVLRFKEQDMLIAGVNTPSQPGLDSF